jgi:aspartyl-tRNA(Asn)/glutamyl-tRNA(Gln) amidotransferase subunit B
LHFDDKVNKNIFSRKKEEACEYAYIPEPDILPVHIDEETIQKREAGIHELPAQRYQRFLDSYGLPKEGAWVLSINKELSVFFEELYPWVLDKHEFIHFLMGPFKLLNKKEANDFFLRQEKKEQVVSFINMITQEEISRETAYQNIWPVLLNSENKTTFDIAKENDWLINNNDAELLEVIQKIISDFPEEKNAFQNGKSKIIGFFMGQIMKTTKNRFQPRKIKQLLLEELKNKNYK